MIENKAAHLRRLWSVSALLASPTSLGRASRWLLFLSLLSSIAPPGLSPQQPNSAADIASLDALVARALERNPLVEAAAARVEAKAAAVVPAGTLMDPMLGFGILNFPLTEPGFGDFMTMKMVSLGQVIPYPRRLRLRRRIAEAELSAARARLDAARLEVIRETRTAYFEMAFQDRAREILGRNADLLSTFSQLAESRYSLGVGMQQEVLNARAEQGRFGEMTASVQEARRIAAVRLNTALDLWTEEPVAPASIPSEIASAAVFRDPTAIRFSSDALGSRAADSPLPPLAELQEKAARLNPAIREHEAMIAVQSLSVELARQEHLPDFDISLQYGQRSGFSDMVSAMVSIAVPIRRKSRQNLLASSASAELVALQAEHHLQRNDVLAEVAETYGELERARTHLALLVKSILPQTQAVFEASAIRYQSGSGSLTEVLDSQSAVFELETEYHRALSDFAIALAELEKVVGEEIEL